MCVRVFMHARMLNGPRDRLLQILTCCFSDSNTLLYSAFDAGLALGKRHFSFASCLLTRISQWSPEGDSKARGGRKGLALPVCFLFASSSFAHPPPPPQTIPLHPSKGWRSFKSQLLITLGAPQISAWYPGPQGPLLSSETLVLTEQQLF